MILYSTGCPKCKILKKKLDNSGIEYAEETSVDKMLALGITQVPVLYVNDEMLPFVKANEYINSLIKDKE